MSTLKQILAVNDDYSRTSSSKFLGVMLFNHFLRVVLGKT